MQLEDEKDEREKKNHERICKIRDFERNETRCEADGKDEEKGDKGLNEKIYTLVHEEEVSGEHIQEVEEGLELRKRRRRNWPKKKIKREAKRRTG